MSASLLTEASVALDPSDPYARREQTFPTLTADQLARASAFGVVEDVSKGAVLFTRGQRSVDFFIVHAGAIEICEDTPDGPRPLTVHAERTFTGELDLLNEREILVSGRMASDGRVARLNRPQFRRLLLAEPDIGEIIMRAFILRRVGLIWHSQGGAILIGDRRAGDTLRLHRFMTRNGYPVRLLEPGVDDEAERILAQHRCRLGDLPVVIHSRDRVLRNPRTPDLGVALGITESFDAETVFDLAVVGAGPGGLAAAVYGASEGLSTVVLESEAPGGQAGTSSKIENYLGFPTGISGQALAGRAQVQAQKFGARLAVPYRVSRMRGAIGRFVLEVDGCTEVRARAVVIATGARYRKLDLQEACRFEGSGIHFACTAMEAGLCENEEVIVVGGGNSAGQAAVFLSRHAKHVHVVVRGAGLAASMSDYLVGRIEASERITLHTETEIAGVEGGRHLERVRLRHRRTGAEETLEIANVFLMLGAVPNTEWVNDCVKLDENGFVCCAAGFDPHAKGDVAREQFLLETSRPGVFAVGDVRSTSVKRVASAVGEGSIVVSAVHRALSAA
jgi:thioredoxin reductase (NADPH)